MIHSKKQQTREEKFRRILMAMTLGLFFMSLPQSINAYNKESIDITVNGTSRNIVVFTPTSKTTNMPLMIITHGMNQDPEYQYGSDKMYEMIDTAKFVIAYPRAINNNWDISGTSDENFIIKTIDEMVSRYGCNRNRVYWSGFSMGSMLIFHCIADMTDKIAAFAPTSGIQFSEQPWTKTKGPINLIESTSYDDTVFGYEDYNMHSYIQNMASVNSYTKYTKTENYKPSSDCYYTGDLEKWTGGANGGEVWMFSYNGGGHWPTTYNRNLLWNFCKRFSLKTPLEEYMEAYNSGKQLLEDWKYTPAMTSRSIYSALSRTLVTYGPDTIDTSNSTKVATATSKINLYIKTFNTAAANLTMMYNGGECDTTTVFDPNFHIYLCFGQSNMEGNATIESKDREYVDPRFKMMAAVDMDQSSRKEGNWYTAYPPLCRGYNGLTPADYFGREMVANLPDSISVGVINVAVGGASIKLFDESLCATEIANAADWFKSYCSEYGNNPYKRLVKCAKEAQKRGVIKGILMHQGCTDNGQQDWPLRVKRVYLRLLKDLGLEESETPLLVGELLQQDMGGVCYGHNSVIATIQSVIPNAHIISSAKCPGQDDGLHFTAEGYRMIGKRYAAKMLSILDSVKTIDFDTSEDYFPLTVEEFNPSLYMQGTYRKATAMGSFKSGANGYGGWRYSKGIDISAYKYLVVELARASTLVEPIIKIFDTDDYLNPCYSYGMGRNAKVAIDLQNMTAEDGTKIDPSHIYMAGISSAGTTSIFISKVYLSNDGETPAERFKAEDINKDNAVDSQDVLKVYDIMKNSDSYNKEGDVNGDGNVDSQDVLKIYDYMKEN